MLLFTFGSNGFPPLLIVVIALVAAAAGWELAKRRGLDQRTWAVAGFLVPPMIISLYFKKSRQRPSDTDAFRNRWTSLIAYDPEIKAAVERLSTLGPAAVERFREAYAEVQTKDSIPLIVADIEGRWAAGDRFDGRHEQFERLAELHRRGALNDVDYADQKRRLEASHRSKMRWSGWWWLVLAAVFVVWQVWPRGTTSVPAGFPSCNAPSTRELVRKTIEEADDNRQVNRKLLMLDDVRELSFDAAKRDRSCAGTAALNSGDRAITWRMYVRGDNVFMTVTGF